MYTKNSINVKSYNGLNIVHWNIDGLIYNVDGSKFSKIEDPHIINLLNKYDIICLSETHIDSKKQSVNLNGYSVVCNDRPKTSQG